MRKLFSYIFGVLAIILFITCFRTYSLEQIVGVVEKKEHVCELKEIYKTEDPQTHEECYKTRVAVPEMYLITIQFDDIKVKNDTVIAQTERIVINDKKYFDLLDEGTPVWLTRETQKNLFGVITFKEVKLKGKVKK